MLVPIILHIVASAVSKFCLYLKIRVNDKGTHFLQNIMLLTNYTDKSCTYIVSLLPCKIEIHLPRHIHYSRDIILSSAIISLRFLLHNVA